MNPEPGAVAQRYNLVARGSNEVCRHKVVLCFVKHVAQEGVIPGCGRTGVGLLTNGLKPAVGSTAQPLATGVLEFLFEPQPPLLPVRQCGLPKK